MWVNVLHFVLYTNYVKNVLYNFYFLLTVIFGSLFLQIFPCVKSRCLILDLVTDSIKFLQKVVVNKRL